ncbi:MAG: ABC transporter permease [Methermicoccaceae archaeon]
MIDIVQELRRATQSITSTKLRSGLTMLGITIGIAAVIANASIGAGFGAYFNEEINLIGSNFIIISSQEPNLFKDQQVDVVKRVSGVVGATPLKVRGANVSYAHETKWLEVLGVKADFREVGNVEVQEGDFITDTDSNVAFLGYDVANTKFSRKVATRNPVDITLTKRDGTKITKRFIVKGIAAKVPGGLGGNSNQNIYIPIRTMNNMLGESDYDSIFASAASLEGIEKTADMIDSRLGRSIGLSSRQIEDEDIKPYTLLTQLDLLKVFTQISSGIGGMLTAVALMSLLVGSIGIMNIMLVSVTERTREVGVMKAVGATKLDVVLTFLLESAVLALVGGLFGVVFGQVASYLAQSVLNLPHVFVYEWYVIGLGVSVLVGVLAGVYPAIKAARMNPVEALRYE